MSEQKGLSSDCKLPPEVALAILMGGIEHPCDKCNWDRSVCRGFPRKDIAPRTLTSMSINVYPYQDHTELHYEVRVGGERFVFQQTFFKDDFTSLFDLVFNQMKYKFEAFLKKQQNP